MSRDEVIRMVHHLRDAAVHSSKHHTCPDKVKQEAERQGFAHWGEFYDGILKIFAENNSATKV